MNAVALQRLLTLHHPSETQQQKHGALRKISLLRMKDPVLDYGTPQEEAWRWKLLPWYLRYQRSRDTYPFTVKYYDKPEGEDLIGKLIASNRCILPYATTVGIVDATMHYQAKGFQQMTGRILYWMWPAVGATTAFTTAAYFGARLRQKDDYWNYAAGAICAGSVIGAWQRNHVTGWVFSLFFLIGAKVQRIRCDEGWKFWTFREQQPGDHRSHKWRWEIYKEPMPKGYTTSTEERS